MKSRILLVSALFCLLTLLAGARAGSARQVQPLEPEWLRRMYAEGWRKVQKGVLQKDTGGGQFETFSYGPEGLLIAAKPVQRGEAHKLLPSSYFTRLSFRPGRLAG